MDKLKTPPSLLHIVSQEHHVFFPCPKFLNAVLVYLFSLLWKVNVA